MHVHVMGDELHLCCEQLATLVNHGIHSSNFTPRAHCLPEHTILITHSFTKVMSFLKTTRRSPVTVFWIAQACLP